MKHLILTVPLWVSLSAHAQKDSSQYYYKIGLEEQHEKRYLLASEAFDKALRTDPANKDALLQNGLTNLEMRRLDPAKTLFARLIELEPSNKIASKELINIYYNYRQFGKAIELAQKCTECENSQRVIALSFYQQEDYPQAEKTLKAAIIKNPEDPELLYSLARTYVDMEEYKKSIPLYEKVVKMAGAKNNWIYEYGVLLYNDNDFKNAIVAFQDAAAHGYIQSNDFNENLGFALLNSGEYEKAENLLTGILAKKPGDKDLLRDIAESFYKQKQYDKSLTYCQKLMEIDENDGKALYQAGLNFQRKGEKERGMQMCDKAIQLDPSLDGLRRKKEMTGL